jgi:hypothetical protein
MTDPGNQKECWIAVTDGLPSEDAITRFCFCWPDWACVMRNRRIERCRLGGTWVRSQMTSGQRRAHWRPDRSQLFLDVADSEEKTEGRLRATAHAQRNDRLFFHPARMASRRTPRLCRSINARIGSACGHDGGIRHSPELGIVRKPC